MNKPLVSVIIISYNHEKYIRQAIEGCLSQKTFFDYDIIIHDDASTDQTANIIYEYAKTHPEKIIPILQKENQRSKGVNKLTNFILPASEGKYLARCEGDDYWIDPYKLEKQVEIMENDPSISMCFTATKREFADGKRKPMIWRYYKGDCYVPPEDAVIKGGAMCDLVTTLVRKDIYDDLPDWYQMSPVGDVALNMLAMVKGNIYYLDHVTAVYRSGVKYSATQRKYQNPNSLKDMIIRMIAARDAFDEYTHNKYHKYIKRRNSSGIKHLLLLHSNDLIKLEDESISARLSSLDKIEVKLFSFFKAYKLWLNFRFFSRLIKDRRTNFFIKRILNY